MAAKYTWAVKKGYSVFYFPNGLKIENREVTSWRKRFEVKKYTVPVVVVVDFMDIDKEDCYRYKENDQVVSLNLYVYNLNGTMVWSKAVPDETHIHLEVKEGDWDETKRHWLVRAEDADYGGRKSKYLSRRKKLQQFRKCF